MKVVEYKECEVVEHKKLMIAEYCCDKMKKWLEISGHGYKHTLFYDENKKRFMIKTYAASYTDYSHDGEEEDGFEELTFCPFCGTKLQEAEKPEPKPEAKSKKSWWGNNPHSGH